MESATVSTHWGAELIAPDTVWFRLWAPGHQQITLQLNGDNSEMNPAADGWFELQVSGVSPGATYCYLLADGTRVPDPASRAQQGDVDGPSQVVDGKSYNWKHNDWRGRPWQEIVTYELHIGTFTPAGTFRAAITKLPYLADLGVTAIELLPLAQFGGNRGWGYDGVLLYAPHSAYGTPDDLKALVDAAHGLGISVILDIVLNHFGPQGNFLPLLAPDFFDKQRHTPWGAGIAYQADAVRHYISDAPLWWLQEYRLDGLRFDAIDQIQDDTQPHILVEIARRIRAEITDRPIHLTSEDCRNIVCLHPYNADGSAPLFTAEWNDDFHNAAHVLATDETHAYYEDFSREPEALLARALAEGFAYQGEASPQSGEPRGVDSRDQPPLAFVDFIQNHDQIGNRAQGERLLTLAGRERTRVLLAALLLSPHSPLLFMGEEYGETRPFMFFTDFHGELAEAVRNGRAQEFAGHSGYAGDQVPDPNARQTFADSKLNWQQTETDAGRDWLAFTRRLLQLRQQHIVPLLAKAGGHSGKVIALAPGQVTVSWALPQATLSLAFNLGKQAQPLPELPGDILFSWPPESDPVNRPQQEQPARQQEQEQEQEQEQAMLARNSIVVRLTAGAKK